MSEAPQLLAIQDVTYRYPDGMTNVVDGVTLRVPPGSSLALCGASGSGKTTLADIVLGLLTPDAGTVTFGDVDVSEDLTAWRRTIAYVPQDVHIFDASIIENVAFGSPGHLVDRDKVKECLERAQLSEWIDSLEQGLDSGVGERGKRMSGGQRQRLGIARALYRDPLVLILDEATSALDNETEHHISEAIASLKGQVSTIIIAHRLSTVKGVECLAYLDAGSVEAQGSFREVQQKSDKFRRLVELGMLDEA